MPKIRLRPVILALVGAAGLFLYFSGTSADTQSFGSAADSYLQSGTPNANNGSKIVMDLNDDRDGVIKFDISAIPPGSSVTSAILTLRATSVGSAIAIKNYGAHRILADWSESTVTWNTPGSTAGTHFAISPTQTIAVTAVGSYAWDVTADVADFVSGAATNLGWRIIWSSNDAGTNKQVKFGTKEDATASNRPILNVTYAASDAVAPASVADLGSTSVGQTTVALAWTAPGDDGSVGTAASYDLRYSTSPITDDNWPSATQAAGEPAPSAAGTPESLDVTGLSAGTRYYFALKTADEVPNVSGLSNVYGVTTSAAPDAPASGTSGGSGETRPVEIQVGILPEACTTDRNVMLLLHAHNAAFVKVSDLPDLSDAEWLTYAAGMERAVIMPWVLPEGDGKKTVYIVFRSPYGLESDVQEVPILLDRATQCRTAEEHPHIVGPEGRIEAPQTDPRCLSDYAHAVIEPYVVGLDGQERGWRDQYAHVARLSSSETQYAFEVDGDDTFDDLVVRVTRIGAQARVRVESVRAGSGYAIMLRVSAADRSKLEDKLLWTQEGGSVPDAAALDLTRYPELCASDLVPHAHRGDLIKSPSSPVYFLSRDGKRHAFPEEGVFKSWYPGDAEITTIAGYQLADIPLGENVTYRPGSGPFRIDGDLTAYVVDFGRRLRAVIVDTLVNLMFGPSWRLLERYIDVAVVPDYSFGPSITSESELADLPWGGGAATMDVWPEAPAEDAPHARNIVDDRITFEDAPAAAGDVEIRFRMFGDDGRALTSADLPEPQERFAHLIIVRDDLGIFRHAHPEELDGVWTARTSLPKEGRYYVYADIMPIGEPAVILRAPFTVGANPEPGVDYPQPDSAMTAQDGPVKAVLASDGIAAGRDVSLTYSMTTDGRPVEDVRRWLGDYGHLIILKQGDPSVYVHEHPTDEGVPQGGLAHYTVRFPSTGRYTIFTRLDVGGTLRLFPITVDVPAAE